MPTVNPVQASVTQAPAFKQNNNKNTCYSTISEPSCDSVCFKGSSSKKELSIFKKLLGIITAGVTGIAATKMATKAAKKNSEVNGWNSKCKAYEVLSNAGFSDKLINKTISKMKKSEVDLLKKGFNYIHIDNSEGTKGIIRKIYNELNKDLRDKEKSAELTFKLLSEIFKQCKTNLIYIDGIYASIKYEGAKVFEKGTLYNDDIFDMFFSFIDKDGRDLGVDRIRERFDSEGNKIIEEVDCEGNVQLGRIKYDKNGKLREEWDMFDSTELHYDENGQLVKKVIHGFNGTETLELFNGVWFSDKSR